MTKGWEVEASKRAYEFIKHHENCKLKAYPDPYSPRAVKKRATGEDDRALSGTPWTIGYGSTGPRIKEGTVWTQEQADHALYATVAAIVGILNVAVIPTITQNQFDALVSLCYNIGQDAFRGSTLLRKINQRDWKGASQQFSRWIHAGGEVSPGLVSRREQEADLFRSI